MTVVETADASRRTALRARDRGTGRDQPNDHPPAAAGIDATRVGGETASGERSISFSIRFLGRLPKIATQGRNFLGEVRPGLDGYSQLSRETMHVGVRDGYEVLHIDRIDSLKRVGVASKIGGRAALHTTGLGKAILAAESPAYLENYITACATMMRQERFDVTMFRHEIELTRSRGYSIDDEDDSIGVRCLGVCVLGVGGSPLFAISITGPSPRFTREHVAAYAPDAIDTARALSRQLGWDGEQLRVTNRDSWAIEWTERKRWTWQPKRRSRPRRSWSTSPK